jgi:hypothetical protein
MMGYPGMRSAILPPIARLDAGRLAFMLKLKRWNAYSRVYALLDAHGGQLRQKVGRA